MAPTVHKRVAIIGAGISGLTAARELTDAGYSVSLFEKARGPGGRVTTRRRDSQRFDHGAQFFTVQSDEFQQVVDRWSESQVIAPWTGSFATLREDHFIEENPGPTRWVGQPRMSALGRHLSAGLKLKLSTRITKLTRREEHWLLRDSSGTQHGPYGVLLITCPGPQASALLPSECPSLAPLRDLHYEPCWAVMLNFQERVDLPWDGITFESGVLRWAARDSSKPNRAAGERWILLSSPTWARAHLDTDKEEVVEDLSRAFGQLGSLQPDAGTAHRWLFARSKNESARPPAHFDPSWTLGLSGDGFQGPRIEDAWRSGRHLARLVISDDGSQESLSSEPKSSVR